MKTRTVYILLLILIVAIGCKKSSDKTTASTPSNPQNSNITLQIMATKSWSYNNMSSSGSVDSTCFWWSYKGVNHNYKYQLGQLTIVDSVKVNVGDTVSMQIIHYYTNGIDSNFSYLNQMNLGLLHIPVNSNTIETISPIPPCYPNCTYFSTCNWADQTQTSQLFVVKIR